MYPTTKTAPGLAGKLPAPMLMSTIGMVTMELDVVTRLPARAPDPTLICGGFAGYPGKLSLSWRLVDPSQAPGPPAFIRHSVAVALSPACPRGLKASLQTALVGPFVALPP